MSYIFNEVAPRMIARAQSVNGDWADNHIIAFGCSLGATHAVNCYLRRPDLFSGLLALSGIYTGTFGWGSYSDEVVYANSAVDYMANLPRDHHYVDIYNRQRAVICVGQGAWEGPLVESGELTTLLLVLAEALGERAVVIEDGVAEVAAEEQPLCEDVLK